MPKFLLPIAYCLVSIAYCLLPKPAYAINWDNPNLSDLVPVFNRVYNTAIASVGAVFIIWMIVSGIRYMSAGGDEKAVASARSSLTYAVVGFILILGAYAIINILGNILGTVITNGTPVKIPSFNIPDPSP